MHDSLYDAFVARMVKSYANVVIGDPMDSKTLMGPMHGPNGLRDYTEGIEKIKSQGGNLSLDMQRLSFDNQILKKGVRVMSKKMKEKHDVVQKLNEVL